MINLIYIIKKFGDFMNKKTKKILAWIMLIIMVASVIASMVAYAL